MTIYIVTQGEYSDYGIKAVFTNKEQAMLYAALHNDDYYEPCMIEEYDADSVKIETDKELFEKWEARIDLYHELQCFDKEPGFFFKTPSDVKRSAYKGGSYYVTVYLPLNSSKEKALKVIFDTFAKWKYEQMEVFR